MRLDNFDKGWLVFIAAAVVFLAVKAANAEYSVSDENTYYKMGQLVAEGQVPYRDFFFAHTPLQIYLYAAIFKVIGFNFWALKMLSAIAIVITAAFIFAIVKDKINSKMATAAAVLFLFSYGTLLFSNFPTGTEFATAFISAAFYFFLKKRFLASGLLVGAAAVTAQLSIIVLPILFAAAFLFLKDKKAAIKMLAGFAAVFAVINGVFLIAAGGEYLKQTLAYHLLKPAEDVDKAAIFFRAVKTNWLLFIAAAAAIISGNRTKLAVAVSAVTAAAYMIAFPALKTAFNYYLLFAFPFLAICSAYGLLFFYRLLSEKIRLRKELAAAIVAVIIIASSQASARQFVGYDFQNFTTADEISGYLKANSLPDQTIFGDDSTVPLISLLSRREIALNYVDNNAMRYQAGATDLDATLQLLQEAISKKRLKFVLLRRIEVQKGAYLDFGIGTEGRFMGFVKDNCELAKEFRHSWRDLPQVYDVYDCLKT